MTHKNFVQCPSKDSGQSTFQKELENKGDCHRAFCTHMQHSVCDIEYSEEDVLSAQSKAREGFILDCGFYFKRCRETGEICNPLEIMIIADKHFGTGGK